MSIRLAENIIPTPTAFGAVVEQTENTLGTFEMEAESMAPEIEQPPSAPTFTHIAKIVSELVPLAIETQSAVEDPAGDLASQPDDLPPEIETLPDIVEIPVKPVGTPDLGAEISADDHPSEVTYAVPVPLRPEPEARHAAAPEIAKSAAFNAPLTVDQARATEPKLQTQAAVLENISAETPLRTPPKPEPAEAPKLRQDVTPTAPMAPLQPVEKITTAQVQTDTASVVEAGVGIEFDRPQARQVFAIPNQLHAIPVKPHAPQVASQIVAAISNGAGETIELRLDPPELGRVHVLMSQADGGLSAVITTEKADIGELLRRNSDLLAREFSKAGFEGATLKFAHQEQSSQNPAPERKFGLSNAIDEDAAASPTAQSIATQLGGLDIRL